MKVLINRTKNRNPKAAPCKHNLQFSNYVKKLFFTMSMLATTVLVNAQSIHEQATRAGNEVLADAMIRNIMLMVGGIIIYSVIKSGKTKKKDQHHQ